MDRSDLAETALLKHEQETLMTHNQTDTISNPSGDELAAAPDVPFTLKDRFIGLLIVLVMFGLTAGMFLRPVLFQPDTSEMGRHRTRGVFMLVDLEWSRPVGVVLALIGLLVLWGSLTRRSAPSGPR